MRVRKEKDFLSFFNEITGEYVRTGVIKNGKDTGEDPFMASFPELLDIGIMGHCKHGKSGLCIQAGVQCYQNGLHSDAPNMKLEDFRKLVQQCEGKVFQIALGGCGDPDQHENFKEILKLCRASNIVPNFTTSGLGMTEEIAHLCKQYCGAVAVSWYRSDYTLRAIQILLNAGVKTNIHYVLGKNTVKEAIRRLQDEKFPTGINAIIFLLHKPVGLGTKENVLSIEDTETREFFRIIGEDTCAYKIGFDSCTVPALVNQPGLINMDSLDTCEAARWSAYITPDMKLLPCSFDNQELKWAVDLTKYSIQEAWNSEMFEKFRNCFREACPSCIHRLKCMGGCPIRPEVVLCKNKNRG